MEGFMGVGVYADAKLPSPQFGRLVHEQESQAEARQSLRAEIETLEKTVSLLEDAFSALVSGMAPLLRTAVDVPANYRDREDVPPVERAGSEYVTRIAGAHARLQILRASLTLLLDASAL